MCSVHDCDTSARTGGSDTSALHFPGFLPESGRPSAGAHRWSSNFQKAAEGSDLPGCLKERVPPFRETAALLKLPPPPDSTLLPSQDLCRTGGAAVTPSMTSSNSMSSGYCSLDDESEDFTFFTAKTSLFRRPKKETKISETKEDEDKGTKELSKEEVQARIQQYNSEVSKDRMNLASDGTYTGFIKVNLRLNRPVTVSTLKAPGSEGSTALGKAASESLEGTDDERTDKRTSFYLPTDSVKQLHISSTTTTRQVIQGLLKKFMVLDNPCKFALYKQMHRDGQDLFQKLPLNERPLFLRLIAGPDLERLSFVLKENETGEVEWHAFSIPELQNFLVFLDKEEVDRVRAVELKYKLYRQKLQQALQQHDP